MSRSIIQFLRVVYNINTTDATTGSNQCVPASPGARQPVNTISEQCRLEPFEDERKAIARDQRIIR